MKKRILAASAVCRAGRNAIGLIDRLAEFPVRRKTIFELAAYGPHFERQGNGLANHFRSLAMPASGWIVTVTQLWIGSPLSPDVHQIDIASPIRPCWRSQPHPEN